MNAPREDCWGRMVEPRNGKLGPWFSARRCQVCSRQAIQLICSEYAEATLEGAVHE